MPGPEPDGHSLRLLIEEVRSDTMLAVEKERAARDKHESVCAIRYQHIIDSIKGMGDRLTDLVNVQTTQQHKIQATGWNLNWKAWALAGTIFTMLISGLGYETTQLIAMKQQAAMYKR